MIAEEEAIDIQVICPYHHMTMGYTKFDSDKVNHVLTFEAKCELCLNNVIIKVKL